MWVKISKVFKEIVKEVLSETKRTKIGPRKDTWWWNMDAQRAGLSVRRKPNTTYGKEQERRKIGRITR